MSENKWNDTLKMFITGAIDDAPHIGDNLKKQCIDYIEQLQNENKELKEKYSKLEDKYIKNLPCCNEEDCSLYNHAINTDYILTEFEKWLKEDFKNETEHPTPQIYCNCYSCKIKALEKLEELKEGKK